MSKAILIIENLGDNSAKAISAIRECQQISIEAIREAINHRQPLIDEFLFSRERPAFPAEFRELLVKLQVLSVQFQAIELPDGEVLDHSRLEKFYGLTPERLSNLIATRETSLQQQRNLGHRDHRPD